LAAPVSLPRYLQAAALVQGQIEDGILIPGAPAPSGALLARATGFSTLTCRKALRILIRDGVLVPGASPNARPRVPAAGEHDSAGTVGARAAGHNLSAALAARRHAAGLTQTQLAEMAGVSVTTLGHAETGRLWQSRRFWEHADKALCADGALLELHDAFRAAAVPSELAVSPQSISAAEPSVVLATVGLAVTGPVACVMIMWADGAITTVYPPEGPVPPVSATPAR
jgi:hypothetical protein